MRINTKLLFTIIALLIFSLPNISSAAEIKIKDLSSKKILHIDSYHQGYPWSDTIAETLTKKLSRHNAQFKQHYMNTKIKNSVSEKGQAAIEALKVFNEYKPDLVIATDDNAAKYFVAPYLKDKDTPVVFAGINWDASKYGFPAKNVTGVIEVNAIDELFTFINSFKKISKVSVLAVDSLSDRTEISGDKKILGIEFEKEVYVSNFEEWKKAYIELQKDSCILYLHNIYSIKDFNKEEALDFIKNNTKVITASVNDFMKPYVAITYSKISAEQAELAYQMAADILQGKPISEIPLTTNKKGAISVNTKMLDKVGVTIPKKLLERANLHDKKILHIDSYHPEYPWSYGIGKGVTSTLKNYDVNVKRHYMNTKVNKTEEEKKTAALKAKEVIESYDPDIIIATDDNASKYLIKPYYKNKDIPVVFAGINWTAEEYGFPTKNVTGMVEVNSIDELLKLVRSVSRKPINDNKIAFLAFDTLSSRKEVEATEKMFGIDFIEEAFVSNFEEWKKKYIELQEVADLVYIRSIYGLEGFDSNEAKSFVEKNTKKITFSISVAAADLAAITYANIPEELGEWSANTAIDVLKGKSISDIPLTRNKMGKIIINSKITNNLDVSIPIEVQEVAEIIK